MLAAGAENVQMPSLVAERERFDAALVEEPTARVLDPAMADMRDALGV